MEPMSPGVLLSQILISQAGTDGRGTACGIAATFLEALLVVSLPDFIARLKVKVAER